MDPGIPLVGLTSLSLLAFCKNQALCLLFLCDLDKYMVIPILCTLFFFNFIHFVNKENLRSSSKPSLDIFAT